MVIKSINDGEIAIIISKAELQKMLELSINPPLFNDHASIDKEADAMKYRNASTRKFLLELKQHYGHSPISMDDKQLMALRVQYDILDVTAIFKSLHDKGYAMCTFGDNNRLKSVILDWW